jgi:hypothetical protein
MTRSLLLVTLIFSLVASLARAQAVIDTAGKSRVDDRQVDAGLNTFFGQRFTTSADISSLQGAGGMTSLSVSVIIQSATAYVPRVEIRNESADLPGATVLSTFSYGGGAITAASPATYLFTGNVALNGGTSYWLTFSAVSGTAYLPRGDDGFYDGAWTNYVVYVSGGAPGSMETGEGYALMTMTASATAVPEPATYALGAGLFSIGLAVYRRRKARTDKSA